MSSIKQMIGHEKRRGMNSARSAVVEILMNGSDMGKLPESEANARRGADEVEGEVGAAAGQPPQLSQDRFGAVDGAGERRGG